MNDDLSQKEHPCTIHLANVPAIRKNNLWRLEYGGEWLPTKLEHAVAHVGEMERLDRKFKNLKKPYQLDSNPQNPFRPINSDDFLVVPRKGTPPFASKRILKHWDRAHSSLKCNG